MDLRIKCTANPVALITDTNAAKCPVEWCSRKTERERGMRGRETKIRSMIFPHISGMGLEAWVGGWIIYYTLEESHGALPALILNRIPLCGGRAGFGVSPLVVLLVSARCLLWTLHNDRLLRDCAERGSQRGVYN